MTYFLMAPECMGLIPFFRNNALVAYPAGILAAMLFFVAFYVATSKYRSGRGEVEAPAV